MPPENAQSPTPSSGNPEGSDLHSVAAQIEGLLTEGDDGSLNITDGRPSRAHPDYDDSKPHDEQTTRDNRGRFTKKAATPDDADTGEQADFDANEDQSAASDVETEDTDESGDTDEQLADSAQPDAETEAQDTEEGEAIKSLAEFAEALEIPMDDLLEQITDTFTAAGEETTVTLAELRKGYQKDADYRRGTQQLAERTKNAELEFQGRMQQFEDANRFLATHLQATEQLLTAKLHDPNLAALRQSDPAEWSARREELGQEIAGVQQARQQAMQQYATFHQQQQQDLRTREMAALHDAVPDFNPTEHGEQAKKVMRSVGYTDPEISKIFDHRLVKAAIELGSLRAEVEQLRSEKTDAQEAVKRVKKAVPKLQKPGKQGQARPIKRDNLSRLRQRAQKSGTVDDAAAVIEQMGII